MKEFIYMMFMVLAMNSMVYGQSKLIIEDEDKLQEAVLSYNAGDLITSYELLAPIVDDYTTNPEINALFGNVCFELQRYHEDALIYLQRAVIQNETSSFSNYVKSLMEVYRLNEAEQFIRKRSLDSLSEFRILLSQINNARNLIASPVPAQIHWLSGNVNSAYTEHTPLISENDSILYYTSRRPLDENETMTYDGQYDEDVFVSEKTLDGSWSVAQPIKGNVNDILNDATVSLNSALGEMVVFRTTKNLESSDLWIARKKSGHIWRMDQRFPESINSKAEESGLTMNGNGDLLYISSNRQGGYGGMDIYRVRKFANGEYSRAVNLGPEINGPHDEVSPYLLLDDKTLYFASNRAESMGGFDIFKATLSSDSHIENVENIGYPINTTRDDLHLSISVKTGRAYFTRSSENAPADFDICEAILPGFNLKATVYKISITPSITQIKQVEATLFAWDYSEVLGQYSIDDKGRFIVVILPDEAGVLSIECPGYGRVEKEVRYQPAEGLQEIEWNVELKPISN